MTTVFPNLTALIHPDKFAHFQIRDLYFSLKRDGSLIWIRFKGILLGMIDSRTHALKLLQRGLSLDEQTQAIELMQQIETDPEAAAKADGVLSGRCSCCGRTLTDPESISIGVGPVCLKRAGWKS